jgi:NAD(P)-dependent dehydrogenase (short-subunit alcohol dehydrogenase family)
VNFVDFSNKHTLVTGGANGIGLCVAKNFLDVGAVVTVIDKDRMAGERLRQQHQNLVFHYGDIAEKAVLEDFVASISRPVDYLINNACFSKQGLLSGCSYEDFEYVQRVGVTAPYYLTSLLLKNNMLSPNAAIVNIASTRAFQSQPDTESYSAAKGGIVALTHAMAVSLSHRARVNSISPGWIETSENQNNTEMDGKQHPAGRVGTTSDISDMVLYLCGDNAGFITGENITIDGGMSKLMVYHNDYEWKLNE